MSVAGTAAAELGTGPPPGVAARGAATPGFVELERFAGTAYKAAGWRELGLTISFQGGSQQKAVRLLGVAPGGYRTSKNGRKYYRQPADRLTTDLIMPAVELLQAYFDRWGIEVNHRDEKEILGVGQAQAWNEHAVSKVPALLVAMYSCLRLAGRKCYGPTRTPVQEPLPKWRREAKRPSCLDLITLLHKQLAGKNYLRDAAACLRNSSTARRACSNCCGVMRDSRARFPSLALATSPEAASSYHFQASTRSVAVPWPSSQRRARLNCA